MTQDPIQPLADIGRRVLQTSRYLTKPPVPDLPQLYESRLGGPVLALSGICGELLERLAATPVAAEPEGLPNEPVSRRAPAPNPDSAPPTLSRPGAAGSTADRRDVDTYSRTEVPSSPSSARRSAEQLSGRFTQRSDTTGPGVPRPEWSRRSSDESGSSEYELDSRDRWEAEAQWELGGAEPQMDDQEASLRHELTRRAPVSRDSRHRADRQPTQSPPGWEPPESPEGEPSPEAHGEERAPVRQGRPEARRTETPSDGHTGNSRAENDRVPGAAASDVPVHRSRLTASTERLAAMLHSHVAQPETVAREGREDSREDGQEGRDVFPSLQEESGTSPITVRPRRARPSFEEIMERLADELETEFVRTYGSSGG